MIFIDGGENISSYKIIGTYQSAPNCRYGNQEGENVNYLYCDFEYLENFDDRFIRLKKEVVSEEGKISEVVKWDIEKVVIDPREEVEIVSVKCSKPEK